MSLFRLNRENREIWLVDVLIYIEKFKIRELSIYIRKSIEISRFNFIYFENTNVYRNKFCIIKVKNEKRDSVDVNFKILICFSITNIWNFY